MEYKGLNELRELFLAFFEGKGHLRLPSYSLIPQGDKSLLLINAGMAPMKKFFTGELEPPGVRVTTCQKCIRTPDIERVGKTSRHGTYFEMLGNFSFDDYFKREAIAWAWEFCTETISLPTEKLYISVYVDDEETYRIWREEIGIMPDHLVRLGKEDNFWELGAGPCGPCSEIYYDRGEKSGCGSAECKPGCDCDRFVEFWNLVFTQFENDGDGNYINLSKRNIDTGMGLERLACIVQGVDNLFEVDTVQKIMNHVMVVAGASYRENEKTDTSLRVITDHIRSTTFLIGDGVVPSNEGRGYVLRRLIRRASRHGRLLGITKPFLSEICSTVIEMNHSAYPYLSEKQDFIKKVVMNEEVNFERTVDTGLQMLSQIISDTGHSTISGFDAFKLSDTYGFPLELTIEIAQEKGLSVDEEEFRKLIEEQRSRARKARKKVGEDGWVTTNHTITDLPATTACNNSRLETESVVLAIIDENTLLQSLENGVDVAIVLEHTSFYPESGGQLGDVGVIKGDAFVFKVRTVSKTDKGVIYHHGQIVEGTQVKPGDRVFAAVDKDRRYATGNNHTAAHLLHAALKSVLGSHVQQAGQEVGPELMRFDFTHFSAMTDTELSETENLINNIIMSAQPVTITEMSLEQAKAAGAIALFESKYGDTVRVVSAGNFSVELCGGTHVQNTGNIGLFKILSESSVAAGVRRIEGITGKAVVGMINNSEKVMKNLAITMKSNISDLEQRAVTIAAEIKEKDKQIEALKRTLFSYKAVDMMEQVINIGSIKLIKAVLYNMNAEDIRLLCDAVKSLDESITIIIAGIDKEKESVSFSAACAPGAIQSGVNAGLLVKQIASIAGGSGGGRPDSAMAGSKNIAKTNDAMAAVDEVLLKMLK